MEDNITVGRELYWDNIKGILIFLVVFAHCLYGLTDKDINAEIVQFIYYFHMPAFVFVSGYFSKTEKCRSKQAVLKLIIAYALMMIPFNVRTMYLSGDPQFISPKLSAWYLLALIVWRVITPHVVSGKWHLFFVTVFAVMIGYFTNISDESALAINKVVVFWPFFAGGYLLPNNFSAEIKGKTAKFRIIAGVLSLTFAGFIMYFANTVLGATMRDLLPNDYIETGIEEPIVRIAVFAVATLFIISMMMFSSEKRIPILTSIGKNSLLIYMAHRMFTIWFYESETVLAMRARYQILGAIILSVAIVLVFGGNRIGEIFNGFLKKCARVVDNQYDGDKPVQYKIVMGIIIIVTFIVPIVYQMVR
ncbi:MAG: acyltransferase family protein [Anaerovoracaceae bacterium]